MKLSEAIRMNGMMKPQGFGGTSIVSLDAPCALGGALQSIAQQPADRNYAFGAVTKAWPWAAELEFYCPIKLCLEGTTLARNIIWHLNDQHRWTREQIAAWVATVEPQETEIRPIPSELATEKCFVE